MSSGRAAACMCAENEALIKALRVQIAAQRREMVGMAAELEDAKREIGAVRAEMAEHREGAAAKYEEARCKIASLQAWAELAVSGTIAPGAYVNDIMSAQPLAVETSMAAGAGAAVVPVAAAAGAARGGGGGGGAGAAAAGAQEPAAGGGGESALVESLRRQLRVHENENTPSRHRSQKNRVRKKYQAIVKIALSAADATEEEAAAAAAAAAARPRGGQPGHKGASNSQKAEALFQVPLDECPHCHGDDLERRRPGTKRVWDVLGGWVCLLTPKDGRAREMVELAVQLEGLGAAGPCVCVSVSFARMYCRPCGRIVKASVTFLIDGSAMGEILQGISQSTSGAFSGLMAHGAPSVFPTRFQRVSKDQIKTL